MKITVKGVNIEKCAELEVDEAILLYELAESVKSEFSLQYCMLFIYKGNYITQTGISLQSIGIKDGETLEFRANVPCPDKQRAKRHGIPKRTDIKQNEEPPADYNQRVARLQELGYQKDEVEKALKVSFYNADRAYEFLSAGQIPSSPTSALPKQQYTPEQKQAIHNIRSRLAELKHPMDHTTIVQVYEMVNMKEEEALQILMNLDN